MMPKDAADRTWIKTEPSAYQLRDITHFPDWRNLIVWDAFFNNLTSGLMVVACLVWLAGPPAFTWMLPVAMTIALVLVLVDLALLVLDLGDPWRFYHAMRVMRFTSPLSVGVWGLISYATFLALATLLSWTVWNSAADNSIATFFLTSLARLFTVMALIGAIVVICYKGVVFSCSSQPGLSNARWLTSFMVSDSLLMGFALYTFIALPLVPRLAAISLILPLVCLVVARSVTFGLLWQDVKNRARLIYRRENMLIGIVVYGAGGILPLLLAFLGIYALSIASILIICAGVMERFWLIGLARPRPELTKTDDTATL